MWPESGWAAGQEFFVSLLVYVDDIVLLAETAEMLQTALDIASQWAREVRIRWNLGSTKSAGIMFGIGRRGAEAGRPSFTLSGHVLEFVQWYKYLGVPMACGGSGSQLVLQIRERAIRKTRELVAWCSQRLITLDLAAILWSLYVERSALFGAAVVVLPKSLLAAMDRIQRMCGRILLGHSPRSPSPCILAELGWVRWSAQLVFERARLLSRLVESTNDLTQLVMGLDAGSARSWAAEVAGSFSSWVSDGMPQEKHEWGQAFSQWKRDARFLEADRTMEEISSHSGLANYVPVVWVREGRWSIIFFYMITMWNPRKPALRAVWCAEARDAVQATRKRSVQPRWTIAACTA